MSSCCRRATPPHMPRDPHNQHPPNRTHSPATYILPLTMNREPHMNQQPIGPAVDLARLAAGGTFRTVLADPPWRFTNRTGKIAPEHRRLSRYGTMSIREIGDLPVKSIAAPTAHLYL